MSAVGSLIFCTKCGNLLDTVTSATQSLSCSQCNTGYDPKSKSRTTVKTDSRITNIAAFRVC